MFRYDLPLDVIERYTEYLKRHIEAVQYAGIDLGVPMEQLNIHDKSKWSKIEFEGYAKNFYGGGEKYQYAYEFSQAWLHHIHLNEHHWEHWIFPNSYDMPNSQVEDNCLPMPDNFVLEMIADWQGASFSITGSWDIGDWLQKQLPKVRLHSQSKKFLIKTLKSLSYKI